MGTLSKIKELCESRNVAISRLEKDCGFSNASIKALRNEDVPFDRVVKIAMYFDVPLEYFITNDEYKKKPAAGMILSREEQDIIKSYRIASEKEKNTVATVLEIKRQDTGLRSEKVG